METVPGAQVAGNELKHDEVCQQLDSQNGESSLLAGMMAPASI